MGSDVLWSFWIWCSLWWFINSQPYNTAWSPKPSSGPSQVHTKELKSKSDFFRLSHQSEWCLQDFNLHLHPIHSLLKWFGLGISQLSRSSKPVSSPHIGWSFSAVTSIGKRMEWFDHPSRSLNWVNQLASLPTTIDHTHGKSLQRLTATADQRFRTSLTQTSITIEGESIEEVNPKRALSAPGTRGWRSKACLHPSPVSCEPRCSCHELTIIPRWRNYQLTSDHTSSLSLSNQGSRLPMTTSEEMKDPRG